MLFDTHAHFDDEQFDNDRDALLMSLSEFGVSNIVNIGSDMKTNGGSSPERNGGYVRSGYRQTADYVRARKGSCHRRNRS